MGRVSLLFNFSWQQIAKHKGIPVEQLANGKFNGTRKNGPVKNKGVELAIFPAGIDARRQLSEKRPIELAPGKTGVKLPWINASSDRAKAERMELAYQYSRIALPERKH